MDEIHQVGAGCKCAGACMLRHVGYLCACSAGCLRLSGLVFPFARWDSLGCLDIPSLICVVLVPQSKHQS